MLTGLSSNVSGLEGALIGLAILIFFVVRQFTTRRIAGRWSMIAPLALAYFGLQGLGQLDSTGWLLLGLSLSLAVVLGFARGTTMHVWIDDSGAALMRGTAATLVMWLATIAVKVALSIVELKLGFGTVTSNTAETMLPAAATIAAQTLVAYLRSQDQQLLSYRAS